MQRIFIGIPVDARAQHHINCLLKPLKESHPDLRWVPENNRHLTLAFLGDVPLSTVENLVDLLDETYRGKKCSRLSLTRLTRFPEPNSKIIALTGEPDRSLDRLLYATSRLLQSNDQPEDPREFLPHVTLARFGRKKGAKIAVDQPVNIKLEVTDIRLYQSVLTESGPIYSVLKESKLVF